MLASTTLRHLPQWFNILCENALHGLMGQPGGQQECATCTGIFIRERMNRENSQMTTNQPSPRPTIRTDVLVGIVRELRNQGIAVDRLLQKHFGANADLDDLYERVLLSRPGSTLA